MADTPLFCTRHGLLLDDRYCPVCEGRRIPSGQQADPKRAKATRSYWADYEGPKSTATHKEALLVQLHDTAMTNEEI